MVSTGLAHSYQIDASDAQGVTRCEARRLYPSPVDEGSVGASQILDLQLPTAERRQPTMDT
jgi:hypothetical protein